MSKKLSVPLIEETVSLSQSVVPQKVGTIETKPEPKVEMKPEVLKEFTFKRVDRPVKKAQNVGIMLNGRTQEQKDEFHSRLEDLKITDPATYNSIMNWD